MFKNGLKITLKRQLSVYGFKNYDMYLELSIKSITFRQKVKRLSNKIVIIFDNNYY